jgi:hypothetical protein
MPPFPLLRKGNFPSKLSGNCQPGVCRRFRQAHIFLDTQQKRRGFPAFFCFAANRETTARTPSTTLTQQNLCYFVAFAHTAINTGAANSEPSFPVCVSGSVLQQNTGFVSFGLLPSFLCSGKSIVHYVPRFVNW